MRFKVSFEIIFAGTVFACLFFLLGGKNLRLNGYIAYLTCRLYITTSRFMSGDVSELYLSLVGPDKV